jgi:hypothetical protein
MVSKFEVSDIKGDLDNSEIYIAGLSKNIASNQILYIFLVIRGVYVNIFVILNNLWKTQEYIQNCNPN